MSKKINSVVKRNGERAEFDIAKIKKSIAFATDGMGVSALHLEASMDRVFKNGMTTSDIQDNVIRNAVLLASPENPQWSNVAGRALAMQLWGNFPLRDKSFSEIVAYNIKKGNYSSELNNFYSADDITELGKYIDHERDLEHSYASLITAKKKYLGKYELNQHMHMVSAMRFGQREPEKTRVQFVKELYDSLSLRKISLATPFMANLRKGGNVASCFIVAVEDDLDSIFNNVKRVAKISKNGGGVGIYLGKIRAKGATVNGYENAAGTVVQWVKVFNDTLVAVNQSFTGDTLIDTSKGMTKISDIKDGDLVKTHDGSYKSVVGVRSNVAETPIYDVHTSLGKTRVTSAHPILVVKRNGYSAEVLRELLLNGKIKPEWVNASELTTEHMVLKSK